LLKDRHQLDDIRRLLLFNGDGRFFPETGKATEIPWYISGKVEMVSPVRATVDLAKRIATKVIDHQIASEAKWKAAETRYQRGLFFKR